MPESDGDTKDDSVGGTADSDRELARGVPEASWRVFRRWRSLKLGNVARFVML